MNIYKNTETAIRAVVVALQKTGQLPQGANVEKIEAQSPKDASHGDIATNAAMVLAAHGKTNPRAVAQLLLPELKALGCVEKADIAGPGFINLTLKAEIWQGIIPHVLQEGRAFGSSGSGKAQKVNVEYVSANPTGPMHVGHGRGAVVGDALANLLVKAGYDVTREYYTNDAGAQIDKLADSAFLRYRQALGEIITEIPDGLYPGEYLIAAGKGLASAHGKALLTQPREQWLPLVRDFTVNAMMELVKQDLALLGIHHDIFTSEHALTQAGKVEHAIALLEQKGLIYNGVLEAPKGKVIEDWEPRPQTLFRSTRFGDDCDRPVKKSDGSWTYFAPDIAYHFDKVQRGYTRLIDLFGVDHGGYAKRIQAAVAALSDGKATLEVKLCALVKFMRKGEPLKMSKRAGTFVTVREVVEEVGKDVFRFIMLTRRNDMPLDFDFEKVMEQSKDNPVFYVQYAHARAKSVLRNAESEFPGMTPLSERQGGLCQKILARLAAPEELSLLRLMASWPRMVESAAVAAEPHRIAFYLQELAAAFHGLWNRGNEEITLRFIIKHDIELTTARVALVAALAETLASGLELLGVEPMEEMR